MSNDQPLSAIIQGQALCMSSKKLFKPRRWGLQMSECSDATNRYSFAIENNELQMINKWGKAVCVSYDEDLEVTTQNCGEEGYSQWFDYNTYTGQIQIDESGSQCLDVDTRGNYYKVIIGECESSTYVASSFGEASSSDELFDEVEGLVENAVLREDHEWVLFSNEWDSNVQKSCLI